MCLIGCGQSAHRTTSEAIQAVRPEQFGIALPFPVGLPPDSSSWRPDVAADTFMVSIITIDSLGAVREDTLCDSAGDEFQSYLQRRLGAAEFVAGEINGQAAETRLPVRVRFRPGRKRPIIHFPIDQRRRVTNDQLYLYGLELNGYCPPTMISFPSYYGISYPVDSVAPSPLFVGQVRLDTTGKPVSVEPVLARDIMFTDQLLSAINWGRYLPASLTGKPIEADYLLVIRFFPELSYPTFPWADRYDTLSLIQRFRVGLVPPWTMLLALPVPRNLQSEGVAVRGAEEESPGMVTATIGIDGRGEASLLGNAGPSRNTARLVQRLVRKLHFYPALDSSGVPATFLGLLRLEFSGSKTVRIHCLWLEKAQSPGDSLTACSQVN